MRSNGGWKSSYKTL